MRSWRPAARDEAAGARRFSIVTAGRSLKGEDLERALSAYRAAAPGDRGGAVRLPRPSDAGGV